MEDLEGKWDRTEEIDKTILVKGVPRMGDNLVVLGRLTHLINPPRRQLRAGRQAVDYLMDDASVLGFGLVLWGQRRIDSESDEFSPLYQGS